jgi:hypothetical protein
MATFSGMPANRMFRNRGPAEVVKQQSWYVGSFAGRGPSLAIVHNDVAFVVEDVGTLREPGFGARENLPTPAFQN